MRPKPAFLRFRMSDLRSEGKTTQLNISAQPIICEDGCIKMSQLTDPSQVHSAVRGCGPRHVTARLGYIRVHRPGGLPRRKSRPPPDFAPFEVGKAIASPNSDLATIARPMDTSRTLRKRLIPVARVLGSIHSGSGGM